MRIKAFSTICLTNKSLRFEAGAILVFGLNDGEVIFDLLVAKVFLRRLVRFGSAAGCRQRL